MRITPALPVLLALAGACSSSRPASTASTDAAADVPRLAFEKYTLKNGLTVVLHPDRRAPVVTVNTWYHVGGRHEPAGRSGFAHLFEHLMFQGSRHVGDDGHFRMLEAVGATDVNGTTSQDRTNYYQTVPAEELPLALWLESDRMAFLLDTLHEGKLNNQREVVKNERRQSFEGAPYGMAYLELFRSVFPQGHPYHELPIGRVEDLEAATLEDVKTFFRTYYVPSNASLVIAGDFDPAVAKPLIEKAFGAIPSAPRPADVKAPPVTLAREVRGELTDPQAPLAQVTLAWPTPPHLTEDDVALDVLSNILASGKGSRLYLALVERGLAQAVGAHQASMTLQSLFTVDASVAPGRTPADVEGALTAEIEKVVKSGVTPAEVRRAQDLLETQLVLSLESMSGRADLLQAFLLATGDPGFLPVLIRRYRDVTPERVQNVALRLLKKDARVVQVVTPGPRNDPPAPAAPARTASAEPPPRPAPADAWRAQPPESLPPRPVTLPRVDVETLPSGLSVVHLPAPGLPLVSVMLVSRAGAARDPAGKEGRSAVLAQMLTEGIGGADAASLSDSFADLGTVVQSAGGLEASTVSAVVHVRNADAALALLTRMVTMPSLSPEALERTRGRLSTAVKEAQANPSHVAVQLSAPLALGNAHPLARPRGGTVKGISNVTLEDVKEALQQSWNAANVALVVVGDLPRSRALELANVHLGTLPRGTPLAPLPAGPAPTPRRQLFAVEVPGAPQTVLLASMPALRAGDAGVPALDLANASLGGLFTSRLNLKLREEMGVSYGAFSTVQAFSTGGTAWSMTPVQADATRPALQAFMATLTSIRASPVTDEELEMARQGTIRGLPGEFVGVSRMAGVAARLYALNLPGDHYARMPDVYAALKQADVHAAADRWLSAGNAAVLLVGDRARILEAAPEVGSGAPVWLDADGNAIPK